MPPRMLQASAAPPVPSPNSHFSSQYGVKSKSRISHSLETPLFPLIITFLCIGAAKVFELDPLPALSFVQVPIYFSLNPFLFEGTISSPEVEVMHHFAYVYQKPQTGELLRSCLCWNHVVQPWEEQLTVVRVRSLALEQGGSDNNLKLAHSQHILSWTIIRCGITIQYLPLWLEKWGPDLSVPEAAVSMQWQWWLWCIPQCKSELDLWCRLWCN